eukprot:Tamp_20104.p1 GENE.Tamp_20104~~Tamp_20104.p1  ORF type:complete len:320 (-),score=42.70 Tamp_20104:153-1112(-)
MALDQLDVGLELEVGNATAGLPLFETDAMRESERHPNLGSLRSDSRSSFFASYRSIAAFLDEARALSLEQADAAGRHLPQHCVSLAQATDDEYSIPSAPSSPTRAEEELWALPSVQSADVFCAEDGATVDTDEMVVVGEASAPAENQLCAAEYCRRHMSIEASELKPIALARIHDLANLFSRLQGNGIIRMLGASSGVSSIFGFTNFFVNDVNAFTGEIVQMVRNDVHRCWHANGKPTLLHPSSPCYEVLRQLGVHPVRGTRGKDRKGLHPASQARRDSPLFYSEFRFSLDRMRKNCHRLKIGVIGNRRPSNGSVSSSC